MARQKRKASQESSESAAGEFESSALDALIGEAKTGEDVELLFRRMKKALMERILNGELTHHLGYERGENKRPSFCISRCVTFTNAGTHPRTGSLR